MNTVTETISPSSFTVKRKKIQSQSNQNLKRQLTYYPSSKTISVSTVVKYTQPEFEKDGQSKRLITNRSFSLETHQMEMQKLAMELDRKRERFNQYTFYL